MDLFYKLRCVLSRSVKIKLVLLVIGIIIGAQIETLTLSAIQPFVFVLTDPSIIYTNRMLYFIYNLFGFTDAIFFMAFLATAIAMIYVFRGLYVYFFNLIKNRFLATNTAILSNLLLINLLKQPYIYHKNRNSVKVQQYVIRTAERMYGCIGNMLSLLVDAFMSIFILVFLMASSFSMTMVVLSFAMVCIIVYFKIFKARIRSSGDEEAKGMVEINKSALQAIHGVKEIKVARRESFFTNKFKAIRVETVKFRVKMQTITQLPKLFIESLCFSGAFLVVAGVILAGVDIQALIPLLGVFMLAAFKLLPAISRMLENFTMIMRHLSSVSSVYKILTAENNYLQLPEPTITTISRDIIVSKITFKYPDARKPVLRNVSLTIPFNKTVGFVGQSGAGKSTLIDIILGMLSPQTGSVIFNGESVHHKTSSWTKHIGYVPQSIYLLDETFLENVAFGIEKDKIDENKIWRALEQAQLYEFVKSLPEGLYTNIGEQGSKLSGGQRQRIGIARALYENPSILILDEATSALDSDTENEIMDAMISLHGRKTLIIVAHRSNTIKHCDIVYEVKNGKVVLADKLNSTN